MAARYCANCGEALGPNDRFCGNCGQPLGEPDPATLNQEAREPQEPRLEREAPTESSKPSAAPLIAVLIPVFALMGVAWLVGPERLGFAMGSSIVAIIGFVLMLAVVILLLWAAGKLVSKGR